MSSTSPVVHPMFIMFMLFSLTYCQHGQDSFNSISYFPRSSRLNDWTSSDRISNTRGRWWSSRQQTGPRSSSYVMINKEVFTYKPSQYLPWTNWTDCSRKDCSQSRHRKCTNSSWNRRSVTRSYRYGCPVKYIKEKRRCSNIPECKLSENYILKKPVVDKCGIRPNVSISNKMKMKVMGGKQAKPHSWPWQVALVLKTSSSQYRSASTVEKYICGATLVHPEWVITAAHCMRSLTHYTLPLGEHIEPSRFGLGDIVVRMGDHNRMNRESGEVDRRVSHIVVHPKFRISTFTNIYDVALLKIAAPIEKGPQIDFACLPESSVNLPDNTTCIATGWGHTQPEKRTSQGINLDWILSPYRRNRMLNRGLKSHPQNKDFHITYSRMSLNREQPLHLMEVEVPLVNFYKCRRSLPEFYIDERLHLCAGEEGKDTCTGDSGGGLYCQNPGTSNWQLYGITSFGSGIDGCGTSAGIYVKVSAVTDWLRKIISGFRGN